MKKKYISGVMFLALLTFGGCGKQQAYIGADQAKQLALTACHKTAEETDSVTADLVRRNDKDYYQIDIMANGQHYEIEIDALAGGVTEVKVSDAVEAGQENVADASQTGDTESSSESRPEENPGSQPTERSVSDPTEGSSAGNGTADDTITLEDAKAKALAHAGLTADQVTFVENKLDYENGRRVYELEFYTGDYKEYDYEVDASSGEIVSFDHDTEHDTPSQSAGVTISAEDAKALALSKVPGASESDIREFEVDRDDGRTEYEGKIIYNGTEYEFEIDGTGQILSWEEEPAGRK